MIRFLKKLWKDRRGNVLIITGAALPFVVGAAGLATDTIQWSLTKRELQRAADSAALAAVYGQVNGQTVTLASKATTADCSTYTPVAEDEKNGNVQAKLGALPTCTITPSPTGMWSSASYNAAQVTMSEQQKLPFSSLFLKTAPTLTATATAAYLLSGSYCVVSLDNGTDTGIQMAGSTSLDLGCGMKTDAKGSKALDCTGAAKVVATPLAAVGSISSCSGLGSDTTMQPYAPYQTDPFASYSAASVPGNCNSDLFPSNSSTTNLSYSGTPTSPKTVCFTDFSVGTNQTAQSFTGSDLIVIINKDKNGKTSGNFNIGSLGTVNCTRCVFILTTNSPNKNASIGNITVNAQATVNVTASTTGSYPNIAFFQDSRAASCSNFCNTINGSSNLKLQGAVYLPTQGLQVNGDTNMNTKCLQIVAWQIKFSGNSSISNTCDDGSSGNTFKGYMVRLVA